MTQDILATLSHAQVVDLGLHGKVLDLLSTPIWAYDVATHRNVWGNRCAHVEVHAMFPCHWRPHSPVVPHMRLAPVVTVAHSTPHCARASCSCRSSHKLFGPRDFYACQLERLHAFSPQQQEKWKALSEQLSNLKVGVSMHHPHTHL